jgi:HPt (histidine-containing phosphotransfer) domain-containing protein
MNDYLPKPFTPEDLYQKLFDDLKIKPLSTEQRPVTMKVVPSYNLNYLRSVSGNNEEFIREMVSTFIQTVPQILEDMKQSMGNHDWIKLSRLAHQIKPSFILMGLDSLRSDIVFIEENSKLETNLTEVERLALDFIERCYSMLPELSKEGMPAA